MPDLMWPVTLIPSLSELKFLDGSARTESPFNGYVSTMIRPGTKIQLVLRFEELRDDERRLGMATITGLRGASGRLLMPEHTHRTAGAVAAAELVPSPTMLSITGYTAGSSFNLSQVGRVLRMKRGSGTSAAANLVRLTSAVSVTPYLPYVCRAMVQPVRGTINSLELRAGSSTFGAEYAEVTELDPGMLKLVVVPVASPMHFGLRQGAGSGSQSGDAIDIPFMSVSQCALIDNAPNLVPWSTDLANATWNQGANMTVVATATTLPDGSDGVANVLREDSTAAVSHFLGDNMNVDNMNGDWCFAVALKASNRTWAQIRIQDVTAGSFASANINLATGVLGTVVDTAPEWEDARAVVKAMGDGWYYLALVARNTGSNGVVGARIFIGEGDEDTTFTGLAQSSIFAYLPSIAPSSVPIRLSATTATVADGGTVQAIGAGQWTKGWPASTNGVVEAGSVVEINGRKHWVLYDVDSDAAGLAQMFLSPVPHESPDDNEPVIINQPHGKYMLMTADPGWMTQPPGFRTDLELELMEAI